MCSALNVTLKMNIATPKRRTFKRENEHTHTHQTSSVPHARKDAFICSFSFLSQGLDYGKVRAKSPPSTPQHERSESEGKRGSSNPETITPEYMSSLEECFHVEFTFFRPHFFPAHCISAACLLALLRSSPTRNPATVDAILAIPVPAQEGQRPISPLQPPRLA